MINAIKVQLASKRIVTFTANVVGAKTDSASSFMSAALIYGVKNNKLSPQDIKGATLYDWQTNGKWDRGK